MLGPITSSAREAVAPIIEEQKTPLLYATKYEGGACSRHLFFFHMVPNQSAAPLMRYLVRQGEKSFFMVGADYVWPRKMFEACRTVLTTLGADASGKRFVPLDEVQDYSSLIGDIRKKQPDVLVLALPGRVHVAFLEQARKAGLLAALSLGVLADLQTYAPTFAVREGERMFACVPFVATGSAPGIRRFVADVMPFMKAAAVPTSYTMTHYDALMALRAALEGAGEVSREAALEGLPGLRYPIPTGESVINSANHHSTLKAYISKAEGNRVEVVKDLSALAPKPGCA